MTCNYVISGQIGSLIKFDWRQLLYRELTRVAHLGKLIWNKKTKVYPLMAMVHMVEPIANYRGTCPRLPFSVNMSIQYVYEVLLWLFNWVCLTCLALWLSHTRCMHRGHTYKHLERESLCTENIEHAELTLFLLSWGCINKWFPGCGYRSGHLRYFVAAISAVHGNQSQKREII